MYIIKNALKNIARNKGRNLLIGVAAFITIACCVVALMINNTSASVIDNYKNRFGSQVSITPDMAKLRESAQANSTGTDTRARVSIPTITPSQYIKFGENEDDVLQSADYKASTNVNSTDLTAVDASKGGGTSMGMGRMFSGKGSATSEKSPSEETTAKQYYYKFVAGELDDFTNGTRSIKEGSMPENDNEVAISSDLADSSGKKVGDTITLTTTLQKQTDPEATPETKDITYSVKIAGIYDDATEEYPTDQAGEENALTNRRNEIISTFNTISSKLATDYQGITVSATYYLKNPDMLDKFTQDVKAKGLADTFTVSADTASYNRIIQPVESMKNISLIFALVVLIFGSLLIMLLCSISIRERKYEIGVLRAMGMKKNKVIAGIWAEMLVIMLICTVIGIGAGSVGAQPVSNMILKQQETTNTTSAQQGQGFSQGSEGAPGGATGSEGPGGAGGGARMSGPASVMGGLSQNNAQPLSSMDVSLDINTVLEILAIALLLSSCVAVIATVRIAKYEPIKILMERN
jgi:putative ABC transport system permease protein